MVVNTVRATGAANPIIIAGLDWSDDLRQWLQYVPNDPAKQIIAGFHTYTPRLDRFCATSSCWDSVLAPIQAAGYPLLIDEFGETDCAHGYIDSVMELGGRADPTGWLLGMGLDNLELFEGASAPDGFLRHTLELWRRTRVAPPGSPIGAGGLVPGPRCQ